MTIKSIIPAVILALAICATSSAAKPKVYYWNTAQADAAVIAQASIPYCKVTGFACTNGVPNMVGATPLWKAKSAVCVGIPGFQSHGLFSRFTCAWQGNNQVGRGALDIFTAGPKTIRWKSISP